MSKPPRPSLQGLVKPAQSHSQAVAQSHDDVVVQLRDDEVPDALPEPEMAKAEEPRQAGRPKRSKTKGREPEPELAGYAHRSLYAKPETLELIRRIAFEERISAQTLYREGLLAMLRKRGHYRDKGLDDV